jgi:quercetin dioxygenase-like cupin family protein
MPTVSSFRALFVALPLFAPSLLSAQAQTLLENDQVRVLKAVDKPHVKNPPHGHKLNRVMVYLADGTQEITPTGGKATTQTLKKGEVQFNKAVTSHTSEVTSDEPLTIIEVELKKEGKPGKLQTGPLDPLKVAPKSYHLEFENDQVRVIRVKMAAHSGVPQHEHTLNRVVVNLSDQDTRMTSSEGKVQEAKHKTGDASFSAPVTHKEENLQDIAFEAIMIELKN